MSYDYSENILVQESAGNLLHNELGWDVQFAYNTETLGKEGTFGRISYNEILLFRYFIFFSLFYTPAFLQISLRQQRSQYGFVRAVQISLP